MIWKGWSRKNSEEPMDTDYLVEEEEENNNTNKKIKKRRYWQIAALI